MKHFIFSALPAFLISSGIFGQSDLIVYSNNGTRHKLEVNGIHQNTSKTEGVNISEQNSGGSTTESAMKSFSTTETTATTSATTTSSTGNSSASYYPTPYLEAVSTGGCDGPLPNDDFNGVLSSIDSKSFEDSKMTLSKQFTKANCLSVDQVKCVMQKFAYEATKLDYAKFAYAYCLDQTSYSKVNEVFEHELSIAELNEFLETQ